MSNFSQNENFHKHNSHSGNESSQNSSDKSVAFLAALQETQNVLNVLLQAVLYKDNPDPYDESNFQVNEVLESDDELKEFQSYLCQSQDVNEKIKNNNSNTIENRNINSSLENPNKEDFNLVPLPRVNESLRQNSSLSDGQFRSEEISSFHNEVKMVKNAKAVEYDCKNIISSFLNNHNASPITTQNYQEHCRPVTEKRLLKTKNSLNDKELEIPPMPLEANTFDYEATDPSTRENEILDIEEIPRLLQFSQDIYTSCINEVNTILSRNENITETAADTRYKCSGPFCSTSQDFLEPREMCSKDESKNKKSAVRYFPLESIPNIPSQCEKEVVGDDFAKTRTHILCECDQPGVAGGAVPIVTSFTVTRDNGLKDNEKFLQTQKEMFVPKLDKFQTENIPQKAKSSQIPKFNFKNTDGINSLGRTEKQRCLVSSINHEKNEEQLRVTLNMSSKMTLQERLKASTSLIRQKISNSGEKTNDEKHKACPNEKLQLRFDEESVDRQKRQKKLKQEFSKNFAMVAQDVTNLKEVNDFHAQSVAVDNLYKYIKELKRLSNELNDIQYGNDERTCSTATSQQTNDSKHSSFESHKIKTKDNKIYIKFLPTKLGIKKRKSCNAEVQTEASKDFLPHVLKSKSDTMVKKSDGENDPKNVDSMDGIFIPSSDEPPNMEEEDDEDGLDITITFPEFQQHIMHEGSSHLSVCFSEISAEALGRLKRCPKEFTLRMDFVHGKMFFQSGKSPANNFSIGPDMKITECAIDNKMSDIISIKPSTECMYTSQIIPVEGAKGKCSIRTLKSTDSELFNVVSLPTINRKTSGNTKSCITFKNERCVSAGYMLSDGRSYKSMPQIPSLTRILEEPIIESANTSRAAMMNSEKKARNRTPPKKKTNISFEKLSEI